MLYFNSVRSLICLANLCLCKEGPMYDIEICTKNFQAFAPEKEKNGKKLKAMEVIWKVKTKKPHKILAVQKKGNLNPALIKAFSKDYSVHIPPSRQK